MSNFDFSSIAKTTGIASSHILAPYQIHTVKFESIKPEEIEAKSGDNKGKKFKVLKLRFSNTEGYYEETVFLPDEKNPQDFERQANSWGGQSASAFDRFKMFIAATAKAINPDGFAQLQKLSQEGKITNIDTLVKAYVKILSAKAGRDNLALKLVGRNSNGQVRASLPYYCNIGKDGVEYLSNNFISDLSAEKHPELSFTANEQKNKAAMESLQPTNMTTPVDPIAAVANNTNGAEEDASDLLGMIDSI